MKRKLKIAVIIYIMIVNLTCKFTGEAQARETIWEYREEKFVERLYTGEGIEGDEKKKRYLEREMKRILDKEITYTNLGICIVTALENSYEIEIAEKERMATIWEYRNKVANLLPDFNYGFYMAKLSGEFLVGSVLPVRVNEIPLSNTFNVIWDVTNQGKAIFDIVKGKKLVTAAGYNKSYAIDEILLNTTIKYYSLLAKKLETDVYRINLKELEEQQRMAEAEFQVGLSSKFEVMRAESETAKAKQSYIGLFNDMRLLQAELANTIGIDVFEAIYPYEMSIKPIKLIDERIRPEELYKLARKNRDDLRQLEHEIEVLEKEKGKIIADFIPKISIQYTKSYVGTVRRGVFGNDAITLNATIPLGQRLGVGTHTLVKQQEEKIKAAKLKLITEERKIKQNIIQYYYAAKTQLEKIEAGKKEVKSAEEAVKIGMARLKIGEDTILELLTAQSAKTSARQNIIQNIIDYNKAQVQILFEIGMLAKSTIITDYHAQSGREKGEFIPLKRDASEIMYISEPERAAKRGKK